MDEICRRVRRFSLADAVAEFVHDGDSIWIGNFGTQLFSVGHELIRSGKRGLHLLMCSGGLVMDQLIGAGVVAQATFSHCWSPVGPAPSWNFRRAAEGGAAPRLTELSLGAFNAALMAGANGVPFMPIPDLTGTDHLNGNWGRGLLATVSSPFGASTVVGALVPDIAFVFVDLADENGNAVVRGAVGDAVLAAQSARAVVLVTEEVAPFAVVRGEGITIPGLFADGLVEQPGAVRPDGAVGRYDRDVAAYERYATMARTPEGFARWLAEHVFGEGATP